MYFKNHFSMHPYLTVYYCVFRIYHKPEQGNREPKIPVFTIVLCSARWNNTELAQV